VTKERSEEGSESDTLVVRVDASGGDPEYVLMISRPSGDRVRVREWSTANWVEATERELAVKDVYARLERAERRRRRISVDMLDVRAWLDQRPR
jgi:hypothetical protein